MFLGTPALGFRRAEAAGFRLLNAHVDADCPHRERPICGSDPPREASVAEPGSACGSVRWLIARPDLHGRHSARLVLPLQQAYHRALDGPLVGAVPEPPRKMADMSHQLEGGQDLVDFRPGGRPSDLRGQSTAQLFGGLCREELGGLGAWHVIPVAGPGLRLDPQRELEDMRDPIPRLAAAQWHFHPRVSQQISWPSRRCLAKAGCPTRQLGRRHQCPREHGCHPWPGRPGRPGARPR
mmetsp:Transcript_53924/g.116541  ORF Transcript_53924/g.116541 Transcript_53924/m.116541 type:complete len:238 (+) Transcript_53924:260-973(+)